MDIGIVEKVLPEVPEDEQWYDGSDERDTETNYFQSSRRCYDVFDKLKQSLVLVLLITYTRHIELYLIHRVHKDMFLYI